MKPSAAVISRKRRFGTAKCVEDKLCEINAHIDVLCQYVEGETYVSIDPSCFDILTRMTEFASSYRIVKRTHREDFPRDVWGIIAQYTSPQMICTMRLVSRRLNELFSPYVRVLRTPVINEATQSVVQTLLQRFTGVRVWNIAGRRIRDKETFAAIYGQGRPGLRFVLKSSPYYSRDIDSPLYHQTFDIQGADWDISDSSYAMYPAAISGIRCFSSLKCVSWDIKYAQCAVLSFDCCIRTVEHTLLGNIAALYIVAPFSHSEHWFSRSFSPTVQVPSHIVVYLDEVMSSQYANSVTIQNFFGDAVVHLWENTIPEFAK